MQFCVVPRNMCCIMHTKWVAVIIFNTFYLYFAVVRLQYSMPCGLFAWKPHTTEVLHLCVSLRISVMRCRLLAYGWHCGIGIWRTLVQTLEHSCNLFSTDRQSLTHHHLLTNVTVTARLAPAISRALAQSRGCFFSSLFCIVAMNAYHLTCKTKREKILGN